MANNIGIAIAALKQKRDFHQSQVDNLNSAISLLGGDKKRKPRGPNKVKTAKVDYAARIAKRKATIAAKKAAAGGNGASLAQAATG